MNLKKAKAVFLKILQANWFWFVVVFIVTLALYLNTMPQINIGYGDSDLFLTLSRKLGLPLPPGNIVYLWLLKLFVSLPLALSLPVKGHLLSVIFSAMGASFLFLISQRIIQRLIEPKSKFNPFKQYLVILSSLVVSLSVSFNLYFWLYGEIADKYALLYLFTILIIWAITAFETARTKKFRSLYLYFLSFVLGLSLSSYHQLFLFLPAILYLLFQSKQKIKPKAFYLSIVIFLGFLIVPLSSLLYVNLLDNQVSYSVENNNLSWLKYLSKSDYFQNLFLPPNSPIRIKPLDLNNATSTLVIYLQTIIKSFSFVFALVCLFSLYQGYRQKSRLFKIFLLNFILVGLISAVYLGWNQEWITQAEILPQLVPGLITLACLSIFGWYEILRRLALALNQLLKPKPSLIIVTLITLIFGFYNFSQKLAVNDLYYFNDLSKRYQLMLDSVPQNTLLVCFTKVSCHSLLYQQTINEKRADVTILPLISELTPMAVKTAKISKFYYPNNPMRLIDLITTNLGKRPVIATEINETYFSLLGLDAPFMYYIPHGSWGELTRRLPQELPRYDQELALKSLEGYDSSLDPMRLQLKTQPARDHIFNSGILIKMDQRQRALSELNRAVNIFYDLSDKDKNEVEALRQNIEQGQNDLDFSPNASVLSANQLMAYIPQLLEANKLSRAYQAAFGAIMVEPENLEARLMLAQILEKIDKLPESINEYQNVLILEPQNASAAAALKRLKS